MQHAQESVNCIAAFLISERVRDKIMTWLVAESTERSEVSSSKGLKIIVEISDRRLSFHSIKWFRLMSSRMS